MKKAFKYISGFFSITSPIVCFWTLALTRTNEIPRVFGVILAVFLFLLFGYSGYIYGTIVDGK